MNTETLRTTRDRLSELIDRAEQTHDRTLITRNGKPAAVLLAVKDLEALEETVSVLSEPDTRLRLSQAREAVENDDVVHGVDAVRALRPADEA